MDVKEQILHNIQNVLAEITDRKPYIKIDRPQDPNHGDYSTNIAMIAFPDVKSKFKDPFKFAQELAAKLNKSGELNEIFERIQAQPPGFINFWFSEEHLIKELGKVLDKKEKYAGSDNKEKTVVIDYSSPNIAKAFGIGHLRSTIIGQTIYNLYKFLGYKTIGDNHLGDWGTQFGILIYQVIEKKLDVEKQGVEKLEELYVEFNKDAEENPQLRDRARLWFKKLEDGDVRAREIWKKLTDTSLKEFSRIYDLLNIKIDYAYSESFYEKMLPEIIRECVDKKVAVEDQGALVIKFPGDGLPPAIIRKNDGATTYLTRDLATIKFRLSQWDPKLIIYEVGVEQSLHFKQLFKAVELLGWAKADMFVHVRHGLYLSSDGKKFSTRRGKTIHLFKILEEAVGRAEKLTKGGDKRIAKAVGIGAVKYFDLFHNPSSDIIFDWEKMFALEGNSAPYLQYAFARTQSVLAKVKSQKSKVKGEIQNQNLEKEELLILRLLIYFPEVVRDAAENFSPNLLCNYLFELSQVFNNFYQKHKILGSKKEEFRIALTSAVGQILKTGLYLLGIEAPEKM
ncbi:MAG: arginine--tRNA ligase [Patescibacteria group bacterium]|nr:arginine--tRNA ligase [Patescibacteria group bacterium]